ncbi:hypothetical protein MTO96_030560, partial [Rhipicephalus appendiculatus]
KTFSRDPDETQQFLDVGCGIGDLTRDELLPRCLPCRRIVGVDVSGEMVAHAERHFRHDKLEYAKLDIASDEDVTQFVDEYGLFDRVYSFNCLVWVRDQERALKNVARLLKPRGECLLVFHASMHALDVNRSLVETKRWSKYHHLVERQLGLSPSILELPVCTIFDGYSFQGMVDMYVAKSPLYDALSGSGEAAVPCRHGQTRFGNSTRRTSTGLPLPRLRNQGVKN